MTSRSDKVWPVIAHAGLLIFTFVPILWGLPTSLASSSDGGDEHGHRELRGTEAGVFTPVSAVCRGHAVA